MITEKIVDENGTELGFVSYANDIIDDIPLISEATQLDRIEAQTAYIAMMMSEEVV